MKDQFQREIDYLRISITDRCNLRCQYCMPQDIELVSMRELLTYEELIEIVKVMAKLGIHYVKVTGGEPLVRKDCAELIKKLKEIEGIERVSLTTNGVLLKQYLPALLEAGLDAVNISLDTMNEDLFSQITRKNCGNQVKRAIQMACESGLQTKVNAVLMKGYNESAWEDLILLAKDNPIDVRFIEMMPIGMGRKFETVSSELLLTDIQMKYPNLEKEKRRHGYGPAVYYKIPEFQGSIGLIGAIHGKFCASCNRVRLTSQGMLKPCLSYESQVDLKSILRQHPEQLEETIERVIYRKPREHCFENLCEMTKSQGMSEIGG